MQTEKIKLWQPWKNSTGPKSSEGKARCSRNAYKGGIEVQLRQLRKELANQKRYLKRAFD